MRAFGLLCWAGLIGVLAGCLSVHSSSGAALALDGVELRLVRHNGERVQVRQLLRLTRGDKGLQVSGYGGCNRFSGRADFDASGRLAIGPLASTRRACASERAAQRESAYLAALRQRAFAVESGGSRLSLHGDRDTLEFAAVQ